MFCAISLPLFMFVLLDVEEIRNIKDGISLNYQRGKEINMRNVRSSLSFLYDRLFCQLLQEVCFQHVQLITEQLLSCILVLYPEL